MPRWGFIFKLLKDSRQVYDTENHCIVLKFNPRSLKLSLVIGKSTDNMNLSDSLKVIGEEEERTANQAESFQR